ncbi:MAG: ATP-binding cassette domain-containing protein [Clostridiales bacterium]|nr:ATP-binding cassette domain-containing protein [Clostridiales bacterium]
MKLLSDLSWYFREKKLAYGIGISMLILIGFLSLIPPWAVGRVVDAMQKATLTGSHLLRWILLVVGVGVVNYVLRYIWRMYLPAAAYELGMRLRQELYEKFIRMDPPFFQRHRTGDLMARATNDVQAVEVAAGDGLVMLVDSLVFGGMVLIMMGVISLPLLLLSLLPMPFLFLAMRYYGAEVHRRFGRAQAAFSRLNAAVQENLQGVRVHKALGRQMAEDAKFRRISEEVVEENMAVARVEALFEPTILLFVGAAYFLAVAGGAFLIQQGSLTIGGLTSFVLYLGQAVWPLMAGGFLINILERGRASYDRIRSLLSEKPQVEDDPQALLELPSGDLEIHIEAFSYPGSGRNALEDIHVVLPQGKTLGVVGPVGSGKTTLLRLLLRQYVLEKGEILMGGKPLSAYRLEALHRAIAYVPQDPFLFSTTVAENIAFGKPGASLEEIQEAARLARVHEDILAFPEGYDTLVGERGVTLSGGQRQRISLARALLQGAEIYLLDDTLSAVDGQTEAHILQHLKELSRNRTVIIVAHRLSAVEHADEILVLDGGRIRERGTHEELLQRGGWYAQVYRAQKMEAGEVVG